MDKLEYQLNAIRGLLIFHHKVIRLILEDPMIFEKNQALKEWLSKALPLAENRLKVLEAIHLETSQEMKESLSKELLHLPPSEAIHLGRLLQMLEEAQEDLPNKNDKNREDQDKTQNE